ncbi:alpha/beta hydrolase [Streptomyces sp. NBC_00459]|uniref:alpha/beta hydrolase n=1 Tax=Streptomyces sp. NBC_00459 TaxID=2975749 RepID=UPI002E186BED
MLQAEEASETVRTDVTFVSNGLTPAGHLHTPDDRAGLPRTDEALGGPSPVEHIVRGEADETTQGHLRQRHEHCRTARGTNLRTENAWVLRSVDQIGRYDSFAGIESLAPRPLPMIAGSESATFHFSRTAVERAGEPKKLFWIDGASHFDLHDKDEYVSPALAKLTSFFGEHPSRPPVEGRAA